MITPPANETLPLVRFETGADDDASRIAAVLHALGFEVVRVFPDADSALVTPEQRVTRAVARLARTHKLTTREQEVTLLLVQGASLKEAGAALEISSHTSKWHSHNVHAKTGTANTAALTRKVFHLAMQGF